MLKLHVILASVRPGRVGKSVADWFVSVAAEDKRFETRLIDLADYPLPMDDEPHHPRLGTYVSEHTTRWSETVRAADAFVIVTPEYNYSFPAALKNALDHLSTEWGMKPVAFVSYGGISGGLRCVQQLKAVVGALNMIAVNEAIVVPFVANQRDPEGVFTPNEVQAAAAGAMLDKVSEWGTILRDKRG